MADCGIHVQPIRGRLLARDDEIDVVAAAQAVIGNGKQRVGVRGQVNANDIRFFIGDVIDEAGDPGGRSRCGPDAKRGK